MKKAGSKIGQFIDTNPIEAFRDLGGSVRSSFTNDVAKASFEDFFKQLLGEQNPKNAPQGEMTKGQEITLGGKKQEITSPEQKKPTVEAGTNYHREIASGEKRSTKENVEVLQVKIQEILIELRRLTSSSKVLEAEFREVTVEQRIESPGKYHITFFELMLSVVRDARLRIEDASAWLGAMAGKKNKKDYWGMFKKHGTSFGLSNERNVATQTG